MMKTSRGKVIGICLAACAVLLAVAFFVFWGVRKLVIFNPGAIYDNDERVVQSYNSYNARNCIFNSNGSRLRMEAGYFSGSRGAEKFSVGDDGGKLTVEWRMTVQEGRFKLVLVDLSRKKVVEKIGEGTGEGRLSEYPLEPGKYALKVVGDGAEVEAEVEMKLE